MPIYALASIIGTSTSGAGLDSVRVGAGSVWITDLADRI